MDEGKYQIKIPDADYFRKMIKCQDACPVNTPSGSYVNAIEEGEYLRSYAIARGPNPFAPICGLICNHPCEKACRRGSIDEPVSIRALKRFAVDAFMQATNSDLSKSAECSTAIGSTKPLPAGRKVAVIGSGPAGMTAAHDLARLGYKVTIFESQPVVGGMYYFGIPAYRLPRNVIKFDMDSIMTLGIEVRPNVTVGRDITIDGIFAEGFEAVLVAVGAHLARPLPITGTEMKGVLTAVSFLRSVGLEEKIELGKRVLVIGGGNVAMDVARTLRRLRVENVGVVCLEALNEMPADKIEIEEGLEEGITFHNRKGPREIVGENGRAIGLKVVEVASVFDENRKFSPQYVEGSETVIPADNIVVAVGQASDSAVLDGCKGFRVTRWGTINTDEHLNVGIPGIFAAGDVATGPGIVIGAVASGQKAAKAIDAYIRGKERHILRRAKMTPVKEHGMPDNYITTKREEPPVMDAKKRLEGFSQVETGYTDEMAAEQAKRCVKCNVNTIFNGELCISCNGCVDVCPMNCLKLTSLSKLEGDKNFTELIKNRYGISDAEYEANKDEILSSLKGSAIIKDEDKCIRCGMCERRCPTGAITMEKFEYEEVLVND